MLIAILMIGYLLGLLIQVIGGILIKETSYESVKSICIDVKSQCYDRFKKTDGLNIFPFILCLMTLILYLKLGLSLELFKDLMFMFMMGLIAYIDFKTTFVYRVTTLLTALIGFLFIALESFCLGEFSFDSILGALIGFIIIALIVFITHGMGEGDIEIAALCGLFLGVKGVLLTLFLGIVLGGVGGTILLMKRSKGLKDEMAFGPYLVGGAMISMLWGNQIIEMYLKLF
ncbi:MAG: A24 family peptidase [Turicibacter sp.]|nr:A24 family peptidase [Turicibacter sp.]